VKTNLNATRLYHIPPAMTKSFFIVCGIATVVVLCRRRRSRSRSPRRASIRFSLKRASPEIRPMAAGSHTIRETNWDDNAYETEIWLADAQGAYAAALTNAKKSSQSPACLTDRSSRRFDRTDKRQII
jgi:hypothetical protein